MQQLKDKFSLPDSSQAFYGGRDGQRPVTGDEECAQELELLSLVINANVGWGLLMKGRYDEAVAQLQKTIEMDGTFYYARYILGQALQLSGHIAEAEKEYKKASQLARVFKLTPIIV